MTDLATVRKRPCGSCPYRRDVASGGAMIVKAKRYDSNSYQLFAGDALVAVAIRYGDMWMAQDGAGRLLPEYGKHASPKALAKVMTSTALPASS